jgi:iron complex outermembrane receptor protein
LYTPFVYLQGEGLSADLNAALQNVFVSSGDPALQGILQQLNAAGLPSEQVAGILAGMVGSAMGDQSIAVVQTDQPILQPGTADAIGALATFQNFGDVDYWGLDMSLELLAAEHFTVFGNLSIVSDDLFDSKELGEDDASLELALNASTFKTRFGGDYRFRSGFSLNAFGRYTKGFPVRSGTLFGEIESYWVFDAGIGYNFEASIPGLRLGVSVQNILDNRHRQFVGAPKIGRVGLARLTYSFE